MKAGLLALILTVAALDAVPAFAHHSFAIYERQKTLTLSGTVKEFAWTSPTSPSRCSRTMRRWD